MKDILGAWKDSLRIFSPSQITTFFLIGVKNIYLTYTHLVSMFWWMLLVAVASWYYSPLPVVTAGVVSFLLCIVALSARPSLLKKDIVYYGSYMPHIVTVIISAMALQNVIHPAFLLGLPQVIFIFLFAADAHHNFRSLLLVPVRSVYLIVRSLPVQLLLSLTMVSTWYLPGFVILLFVYPVLTVLCSVCYVTWIHQNYKVYYERH